MTFPVEKFLDLGLAGFIFVAGILAFREFKAILLVIVNKFDERQTLILDELVNLRRDFNTAVTKMDERTRGNKQRKANNETGS